MTIKRRAALALPAGLLLAHRLGATLPAALAHVNVVEMNPPLGDGPLGALPGRLVVRFSGPIEPAPRAQLLDAGGTPLAGVSAARDGGAFGQLVVTLPPDPGPGAYTVLWNVVSLEDGHEQRGFAGLLAGTASLPVGPPALAPAAAPPADLEVQLTAVPDERGMVQWVTAVGGPSAPAVTRVQYRFQPPVGGLDPLQVNGEWSDSLGGFATGQAVTLAGEWRTEVLVRREGVPQDARLPFLWSAGPAPAA